MVIQILPTAQQQQRNVSHNLSAIRLPGAQQAKASPFQRMKVTQSSSCKDFIVKQRPDSDLSEIE
jgi:hypothetical protein